MESPRRSSVQKPLVLVISISALLILAATNLLETVCFSVGIVEPRPRPYSGSADMPELGSLYGTYRVAVCLLSLILGYLCLSRIEKARLLLAQLLSVDLLVWTLYSLYFTLLTSQNPLTLGKMTVQILAVLLEAAVLWVLIHPSIKKHFVSPPKRGNIVAP